MMQQYMEVKNQYKDCILFYRLGDFYEMFFDDALTASKVLEITLTGRDCGQPERAPMCGVPYHACDVYLNKLIENGFKVAICEQVEDPKLAKGIVKREVIRVVTPGTNMSNAILDETRNNYLMSIFENDGAFGISLVDITTGEFTSGMKVLDTKNCSTGSDKQIPPQELFTRLGTERYTKVSVQETDANGNTVTNDYYVYNEESETDTSKQYTLASVSVNDKLVEQESLLPHLSQNGKVNYDLAQKVAALWKGEYLTLDPDDTNKVTFIDYYNNMVGAFGTIGSVYESTAKSLSGTVTAVDNQRSQVMGVSSDEELTKMIKFQNAYNASSRFINVVNEMIESMITQLGS